MAGRCRVEQLNKREKALLRKAKDGISLYRQTQSEAYLGLQCRGLLRWRAKSLDYTLSQKGLRWLAALEREEE